MAWVVVTQVYEPTTCSVVGKRNPLVVFVHIKVFFLCCEPNTLLLLEGAVQTAVMSCTSVDNWTMFQATESRGCVLSFVFVRD